MHERGGGEKLDEWCMDEEVREELKKNNRKKIIER